MVYIFLFIIALLTFGATASDNISIGGGVGNILRNAPYVIINTYAILTLFTMSLTTAFMNGAALRDFNNNTHQIIFSKPISKAGYFFGHWLGGIISATLPMLGISLGILLGSVCAAAFGWQDADRFGPVFWSAHLSAFIIIVVPNTIFIGSIIFTISTLTRNTLYGYLASILLLVAYIASGVLVSDIQNENIAALLDPLGPRVCGLLTKYWTVDEKNTQVLGLQGLLLANRLIWLAVGFLVLIFGYFKFSFSDKVEKSKNQGEITPLAAQYTPNVMLPVVTQNFDRTTTHSQLWSQYKSDLTGIIRSIPFAILTSFGTLILTMGYFFQNRGYGLKHYPVTYELTENITGTFATFIFSILIYFAGILVWKERDAKIDEIFDTLPTRSWTSYVAKYFAIASTVFIVLSVGILVSVIFQTIKGYNHYEWRVYFGQVYGVFMTSMLFFLFAFMLIQTLVSNKFIGFFVSLVFIIVAASLALFLGVKSNMLNFGSTPSATYSDLAKLSPFVKSINAFSLYWFLFCLMLAFFTVSFWVRGKETNLASRLKMFATNFGKSKGLAFGLFAAWTACASWVFYNTKVLNTYKSDKEQEVIQTDYEKLYKKYKNAVLPSPSTVKYNIEIFPNERKLVAKGDIVLKNNKLKPIDTLFISLQNPNMQYQFKIDNATTILSDKVHGFFIYKFNTPLATGDSVAAHFETDYTAKGFENEVGFTKVVENGTFFDNSDISPMLGYQSNAELKDRNKRKEYGLGEPELMPKLNTDDTVNTKKTYLEGLDSWTNVETTISTSDDQIAIAPGSLIKDWRENGRHYFQYKLDHASWDFYSFISARYEVARRNANGIDFEVYYHKEHAFNVERMLNAMQKSLAYYTANFGPYYHKQCRIIEFPRYASFAQSFPGTMPYSEAIGFIADLRRPTDMDQVTFVVAHEMAHQYWAHQVAGANMQGGTLMSETLAQYSAMMVMEKIVDSCQLTGDSLKSINKLSTANCQPSTILRKFLKYDTDNYLRSRGTERLKEQPLMKVESSQGYIHYRKGSSVMYYLKEMIGEDKVNLSLRTFLEKFRYKNPPFPTSYDLMAEFKKNTPDSLQYILKDLFEDITLFSNRTKEATYKKLSDGRYEVKIETESQKFKADEKGKETEVPVNDYIDIGALSKAPTNGVAKVLYRERVKITQKKNSYTFIVNELPEEAGIDPIYLLIDRVPSDNLKRVDEIK